MTLSWENFYSMRCGDNDLLLVYWTLKISVTHTAVKGLFPSPWSPPRRHWGYCHYPLPSLNQPQFHSLSSQGRGSSPSQRRDLPWPQSGLSRSFLSWRSQNWTFIPLQGLSLPGAGLCIFLCWLWYDSCWPIPRAWTLLVGSIGYPDLVSPAHSMGEHSIISSRSLTLILPL